MSDSTNPHAGEPLETAGPSATEAAAVVIAIHGRGATPSDILSLRPAIDRPEVAWLAPAASGRRWYPNRFIAETASNEPFLSSALARITAIVGDLRRQQVAPERIVFLGFSQGACLASEFVARHPRRWGGLVMLSGGLIGPPGTTWTAPGSLDGTPVFVGCSDVDEHIPRERVEESAEVLTQLGGAVTLRIYPGMPHTVNNDEILHARVVIDRASARP